MSSLYTRSVRRSSVLYYGVAMLCAAQLGSVRAAQPSICTMIAPLDKLIAVRTSKNVEVEPGLELQRHPK